MLRGLLRILRVIGVLVLIVGVAAGVLYGRSEWLIRQGHATPEGRIAVPADAASIAEGARLARALGCRECHGGAGQGVVMIESDALGRLAAPSFASIARGYSNDELARAVRNGLRKDGTTLWVMPTRAFNTIADDDMGRIIAWMRTLRPRRGDVTGKPRFGPLGRAAMLGGIVPASYTPSRTAEPVRPANIGRYYVEAMCMGCHAIARELPPEEPGGARIPPLAAVAAAYDLPSFRRLLRTGRGKGRADLGLMSEVSRDGLAWLRDDEIAAIHAWLGEQNAMLTK